MIASAHRLATLRAGLLVAASASTLLLGCARASVSSPVAPNGERYQLVWSDEFTGDGPLDPAQWSFETGFVRNQELQWYQPENARRVNGVLVIEMRAGIDVRTGAWPAFWTLGAHGPWPANGEIDIMEFYDDTLLFNVAWGGANGAVWNSVKVHLDDMPADWAAKFHVWRMDWDERAIRLFLDDSLMNTQDLSRTINAPHVGASGAAPAMENPFHGPAYLLLNLALGGQHGGDPAKSALPLKYEVDWVRVWQTAKQIVGAGQ